MTATYTQGLQTLDTGAFLSTLTIYSQPDCPTCETAMKVLDREKLAYEKVDVAVDEAAKEKLKTAGFLAAPVFEFRGEMTTFAGFRDIIRTMKEAA